MNATTDLTALPWGHGYGSKRHIVDLERPFGDQARRRKFLAICSTGTGSASAHTSVDKFSDDDTLNTWDRDRAGNQRTHAEGVMRLPPCLRCCKRAGLTPEGNTP